VASKFDTQNNIDLLSKPGTMINANIKGKRLLHLGGAEFQIPAIECAKRLGCFVITVDNRPENPGHRFADRYINVSTVDRDGVLQTAQQFQIDGIMTYGSDVAAPTVCYVAQEMHLPGNPLAAAEILQRKDLFRSFQKAQGIPHPDFFVALNREEALKGFQILGGKVVVKAADSSGSKGQSIISSSHEVEAAFQHARFFSRCGAVVLERFLPADMFELDGDVLVKNGKLVFRHYGHNYFPKIRDAFVPCGEIFPGFFSIDVTAQIDQQFQHIISALKIQTGCMNFDAILSNNIVYLLEIGLRNGGNYVPYLIQMSTGFDLTEAAVLSALGIDIPIERTIVNDAVPVASFLLHSSEEGRFEGFDLSPSIEKNVVGSRLFYEIDAHVLPFTRGDRALGIVFFKFPDMKTLKDTISEIEQHISPRVLAANMPVKPMHDGEEIRYDYVRYSELLSPFLRRALAEAEERGDTTVQRVLSRQFIATKNENKIENGEGRKHYEAAMDVLFEGVRLQGVERLYERVIVVEPLLQCIAHCRHCLRRYYDPFHLSRDDLSRIARFIGQEPLNKDVHEILITGGDPFLIPDRLQHFLEEIGRYAPQIHIARIATRLPVQQPDWVSERILSVIADHYPFKIEVATQVNHAVELFPETVAAYERILKVVRIVYNQSVLLAGVNDTLDELVDLCCALRNIGIENHYIFHCVPMAGMSSLRVPLAKSIQLANQLDSCGRVSGRAKPKLAVMTDIGKITLYEGSIIKQNGNKYLLQSSYSAAMRLQWNPKWTLPANAEIDEQDLIRIWYADSE
jgi:lysine 2,3-aminomutase